MLRNGSKVKMTLSNAKFYLENPDIFFSYSGDVSSKYDDMMIMTLSRAMGVPVIGKVTGKGSEKNVYRIHFKLEDLSYEAYYDYPESITRVK
jgi:hypothetical protein